jgi:ubiquitin C-terminal hydrolase
MDELNKKELEVPTIGFINNGNICYFNSLLQCIINCKYIMFYLINELQPKNKLQEYFKSKFINFTKLYNNELEEQFEKETSIFSYELLKILLEKYKHININEQQSSSEFFLYLIEELGIEHFFKIRHKVNIHCGNCKNISSKIDECYHFEMFYGDQENESVDIDNFMYSVNVLQDYKCDNCKTISKSLYEKQALNISKYFVMILNKYFNKILIDYPNTFEITVKKIIENKNNENITPVSTVWENIGQIEHIGHLNSGHYIALCKRFNSIFFFDDMNVQMQNGNKLFPTKNTYIVFYEKQY